MFLIEKGVYANTYLLIEGYDCFSASGTFSEPSIFLQNRNDRMGEWRGEQAQKVL